MCVCVVGGGSWHDVCVCVGRTSALLWRATHTNSCSRSLGGCLTSSQVWGLEWKTPAADGPISIYKEVLVNLMEKRFKITTFMIENSHHCISHYLSRHN